MFNRKIISRKNILDLLKLFIETIVNIVTNYIPKKWITCNDKDPPWLNDHIKCLINQKMKYLRSASRTEDLILFMKTCKPLHEI